MAVRESLILCNYTFDSNIIRSERDSNFASKEKHQSVWQVRLNETDAPLTRKEEFHLPLLALQTVEHIGANST